MNRKHRKATVKQGEKGSDLINTFFSGNGILFTLTHLFYSWVFYLMIECLFITWNFYFQIWHFIISADFYLIICFNDIAFLLWLSSNEELLLFDWVRQGSSTGLKCEESTKNTLWNGEVVLLTLQREMFAALETLWSLALWPCLTDWLVIHPPTQN